MTIERTLSPARSDLDAATTPPSAPATRRRPFLWHGCGLTAGAVAWAVGIVAVGLNPETPAALAVSALSSGAFQLGLLCLLRVLWRTRAIGSGRVARTFLRIETVLVLFAIGSTTADGIGVSDLGQFGWALLDATWPLSMLGMFAIGVRIAIAGRWHGFARFWPMVAESWAVVTIPAMAVFGPTVGTVVAATHLVVGYAVLGQLVAHRVVSAQE
ncbi:hypothetical protein [uncultured Friedmanniella sp.]|uniref:hypothetical protein n=1 Tax=uncultured Friedmanniella sp. TaxID=335381 RepID=UPI0035CC8C91